jgi:nicotinamide-nucleotide adenylyltransferase
VRRLRSSRALFIGRFQPFHRGHLHLLKQIFSDFEEVVIGIGSAQYSHTPENPFTSAERYEMIRRALAAEGISGCHIIYIPDVGVHSQWVSHVLALVPPFEAVYSHDRLTQRLFEEAGFKVVKGPLLDRGKYSGTEIRRRMLSGEDWRELVPPPVAEFIEEIDGVGRVKAVASQ